MLNAEGGCDLAVLARVTTTVDVREKTQHLFQLQWDSWQKNWMAKYIQHV